MTGVGYGLVVGALLVGYGIYFRWRGFGPASRWGWGFYVLLPAGVLWTQAELETGVSLGAGHYWLNGFVAGLIASAVYVVYVFVQNRFLDDSFLKALVEHQRQRLERKGLDPERTAQLMHRTEALARPAPFAAVVFLQLSVTAGIVAGLGAWWLRS